MAYVPTATVILGRRKYGSTDLLNPCCCLKCHLALHIRTYVSLVQWPPSGRYTVAGRQLSSQRILKHSPCDMWLRWPKAVQVVENTHELCGVIANYQYKLYNSAVSTSSKRSCQPFCKRNGREKENTTLAIFF
jgi:hypothetical protein